MLLPPPRSTLFPYTTLFRSSPFYMLPYMVYSYMPSSSIDGLGGSKTIRGLIRNRVVGDGVVYGNLERSEEHTSELQSRPHLVCRLLLEKKNTILLSRLLA